MAVGMLSIIGVFMVSAGCIHLFNWLSIGDKSCVTIYAAMVTANNELQVEWYLRSFLFSAWLRGRPAQVTVFDQGSTDATLAIARKLAKTHDYIQIESSLHHLGDFIERHREDSVIWLH